MELSMLSLPALRAGRPDSLSPECSPEDRRHATSLTSPDVDGDLVLQHATAADLPSVILPYTPTNTKHQQQTITQLTCQNALGSFTVVLKTLINPQPSCHLSLEPPITSQSRSPSTAPLSSRLPSP
ncbi:hypothetical protein CABS01_03354 [Colletotrichum abscissum]|uniref:uncharacterized protein n=1 Tax=Colletotrichum abscissum TaxID=1671311 RepID=UPI0027D5FB44|nr:uncharacterized protein CABS01_03354 [Colletotrichum abscissum]KAK1478052.1 hypothetical protein CABS01_03354 [Colletotrichum abscissum]